MKLKEVRVLRHAGMLLVLVCTLAAGIAPDWSRVLKAQGYYGAVDLGLSLTSSSDLVAGGHADFLMQAWNKGPYDAHRARTVAGFDGPVSFIATSGCTSDPFGFPQCVFSAPLNAGGNTDYLLHGTIAPEARGELRLSVAVASDDEEINPGDEVAIYSARIFAKLDVHTSAWCDSPRVRIGQPLVCHIQFYNRGPAAALLPTLSSYVNLYPNVWSCTASRLELCSSTQPGNFVHLARPARLMPADAIVFTVEVAQLPDLGQMETAQVYASAAVDRGETDTIPGNNAAFVEVPVSLFFDGFGGN